MKTGFGYDSHRLTAGRRLILGGVEIPSEKGLAGHSDADVLVHAVCDALIGALAIGDIGRLFPDDDRAFKDISSLILLKRVGTLVSEHGYQVRNIDATIVLERPKLAGYLPAMAQNIADVLAISGSAVSVKAKTNEGMGMIGAGEGAAAFAVILIEEA
ncbi:MAG: 2-C-methyl-D-erythritol 2,4-cyclodiphosphate synthase [Syntrophales bacterium]